MSTSTTAWRASAPGSLMLMGEHAVLHGKRALVCAVDQRLQVTIEPRPDDRIRITSALGEDECGLGEISPREPFRFIWAAIRQQEEQLRSGFEVRVESDFSHTMGLGSSAAVTVATLAALDGWVGQPLNRQDVHARAVDVIRAVQGRGSGADAAASVYGGIVSYRADPMRVEPLKTIYPIAVVYAGYKTPTTEVIHQVERQTQLRPTIIRALYVEIDDCVRNAVEAMCRDDWATVGLWMNANHSFMDALGVNDAALETIVRGLREQPGILGAKISGSGLGDCAVGLGSITDWHLPYEVVPCAMTKEGVTVEKVDHR
jgi:mevalonate kinase